MPPTATLPTARGKWIDFAVLLGFLALCFLVAAIGSLLTLPSLPTWYANLNKPSWNPPNSVFGPVWTTLFAMMAVSAWLVWRERQHKQVSWPLTLHSPAAALVDIILLWLAILVCLIAFGRVKLLAAALLLPYLLWVTYAFTLNLAIWRINP